MLKVLALFLLAAVFAAAQSNTEEVTHGPTSSTKQSAATHWLNSGWVRFMRAVRVSGKNFTEALRWLLESANQGNADAQNKLGRNVRRGRRCPAKCRAGR